MVEVSHSEEGKATEMLALIGELYAVEKVARDLKLSLRDRKRLRKKRQVSLLLKKINRWLLMIEPDVPPKSGLGKAINYARNQWPRLIRYVRHGEVEIDNNLVENQIRGPAVGKSNWMFVQREENGQTNAGYYSLIHSCILNGINPGIYIHYVLTQVHAMRKKTVDPNNLLPHGIDRKLLEQFSINTQQKAMGLGRYIQADSPKYEQVLQYLFDLPNQDPNRLVN